MLAIALLSALCVAIGWALTVAGHRFSADTTSVVEKINRLLPQTQCAQCGYPGCRPYAQAIAAGETNINRCPPGGQETIKQLAHLLDLPEPGLAPELGAPPPEQVVRIIEQDCIGCTLCIQACPVDAIVGAAKYMHTVIESEGTGCELCIAPCPVDCIEIVVQSGSSAQENPQT